MSLELWVIAEGVGSALIASLGYWTVKRANHGGTEAPFDPYRTAATLGVAFVVSLGLVLLPEKVLSNESLQQYMLLAGPFVVYAEQVVRHAIGGASGRFGSGDSTNGEGGSGGGSA